MTETQAKSGAAASSATPVEDDAAAGTDNAAGGSSAADRPVVGRASVGDQPAPKFTRPAGMAPPPDTPEAAAERKAEVGVETAMPTAKAGRATVPNTARASANPVTAARGTSAEGPTAMLGAPTGIPSEGPNAVTNRLRGTTGTGKVADAVRTARAAVSSAASRGPRRARLFVKRIDPWSVMKFSFAVSCVLFLVAIVATSVLYLALDAMGVWDSVNKALADMIGATGGKNGGFKITALGVIATAGVLGLVNVVLFTALATLSAFIYNVCADLVGGIEVTLSEKD